MDPAAQIFGGRVKFPKRGQSQHSAAFPPGTYEKLKEQAEEVCKIRITDVHREAKADPGKEKYVCRATVLDVSRSKHGLTAGQEITFVYQFVPPETFRQGFAGPESPPRLRAGWSGRAYLNPTFLKSEKELADFEPAAYGQSFEGERTRRR